MMEKTHWHMQLKADSNDSYNKARHMLLPLITIYLMLAVFNLGRHVVPNGEAGVPKRTANGTIEAIAADSGLRMTLAEPFPDYLVAVHGISATILFALVIYQKHTVVQMANEGLGKAGSKSHRRSGYICLTLALVMDIVGFTLCQNSAWEHFETFSYGFAAPWIAWIVSIYATAKISTIQTHRFLGNMMVKGCIAVPVARLAGAGLQRAGWDEELGYYVGIGGISGLVFLWLVWDLMCQVFWEGKTKTT